MKVSLHSVDTKLLQGFRYVSIDGRSQFQANGRRNSWAVCCLLRQISIKCGVQEPIVVSPGHYYFIDDEDFQIQSLGSPARVAIFSIQVAQRFKNRTWPISDQLMLCLLEIIAGVQDEGKIWQSESLLLLAHLSKLTASATERNVDFKRSLAVFKWHRTIAETTANKCPRKKRGAELAIKSVFGEGRHALEHGEKMKRSWRLLCDNRQSIDQISRTLGYLNMRNFISAFKKYFGVTPGSVQKINLDSYV